jgi:hypothetical protein
VRLRSAFACSRISGTFEVLQDLVQPMLLLLEELKLHLEFGSSKCFVLCHGEDIKLSAATASLFEWPRGDRTEPLPVRLRCCNCSVTLGATDAAMEQVDRE